MSLFENNIENFKAYHDIYEKKQDYDKNYELISKLQDEDAIKLIQEVLKEQNLIKFLLQLGSGFAFVGSHVPFVVNGDEYECDLLFYHLKLRRYIVVELKVVKFEPEFISKLNFYCNAVNHLMKSDEDKNSIGLLICKEKNDVVAQWSLENSNEPIGISTYDLQNVLPSEKEIAENISQK